MTRRMLVTGGFVLTQDASLGDIPAGDILIEDGVIVAVGKNLEAADAEVIDAQGTIVIPGFIDTHRHTWESAVRGIMPAVTIGQYLYLTFGKLAWLFRPEDVRTGTYLGALEALNAGVTTMVDWAHCNNTPEHADAGIEALLESGIRAQYAYGPPALEGWWQHSDKPHPDDTRRVRSKYFSSSDQLLSFALALRGPGESTDEVTAHDWRLARELNARITVHSGVRNPYVQTKLVEELDRQGLLGADTMYVHASTHDAHELDLIAQSGGSISVAPYVEMIMGHGHPAIGRAIAAGLAPTLSIDCVASVPGDMFTQMRTALASDRSQELDLDTSVEYAPTLTHKDVFGFANLNGAASLGLAHKVGSITVGKDADLVLIRADAINTMPIVDPYATVAVSADVSNVDTVIVRGEIRKRDGKLLGVDLARLRNDADASRDFVLSKADLKPSWMS
ncbi:MAG TPA: amidohydrolase family protein [Pseudolysinimonas sp.]|nr:amidohydrolase family protein [Pseudolysinimonas sp.]